MPATPTPIEPGGLLLRPADPTRLPAEKLGEWMFSGLAWKDLSPDQRKRWRAWFDWAVSPGGELWDSANGRAVLVNARLDEVDLTHARLAGADLSHANLRGANISHANLRGARLVHAHLEDAGLQRADLTGADAAYAHLGNIDLTGADLSGAYLHDLDLTSVDFKDARLFGTKITDPVWWVEMPQATPSGKTVFPTNLPEHPIQDVYGLPPLLRRQLADAQYLRDLHRKCGPFGRSMMWLWGLTCSYGQSIGRWSFCTAGLLVFFSFVYTFAPFNFAIADVDGHGVAVSQVHKPDFFQAMYFSISTMMTLGLGDVAPASTAARFMVSVQEIFGYVMLGGLLSIFSNKLARLS